MIKSIPNHTYLYLDICTNDTISYANGYNSIFEYNNIITNDTVHERTSSSYKNVRVYVYSCGAN